MTTTVEFDIDAFLADVLGGGGEQWKAPPGQWIEGGEYTNDPGLIAAALARKAARPAPPPIDYDRMQKVFPKQKAALTRAVKTKDPEKVAAVCKAAVAEWNEIGCWPDAWSAWQRALDDVRHWRSPHVDIADL